MKKPLIPVLRVKSLQDKSIQEILNRPLGGDPAIESRVKEIIQQVKEGGDEAVLKLAKQYDGLKGSLKISPAKLSQLAKKCPGPVARAINEAIKRIRDFHRHQKETTWMLHQDDGVILGQQIRPLNRVGAYVPGGAGVYPSTAMMTIIPAQVAGVKNIAVLTPAPRGLHPSLAYTLVKLGINEVYQTGGAQAIALLALGTKKVPCVDKIVGPGNVYATLAKKELFGRVDIDMIAGPSEILVLADESVPPAWVAADLLSQAEHGSGFEASVCICTNETVAQNISREISLQVETSPKKEILQTSLSRFGRIFVVPDWDWALDLANTIAPEHLEIMTKKPERLAKKIVNAGAIFLGPYTSEPVGDYFAGPNHTLPTNGSARFFSPLGVYDFYKRTSIIQYSQKALQKNGKSIVALAQEEGFFHHAQAIAKRLD